MGAEWPKAEAWFMARECDFEDSLLKPLRLGFSFRDHVAHVGLNCAFMWGPPRSDGCALLTSGGILQLD
jgi:hypothetical protein